MISNTLPILTFASSLFELDLGKKEEMTFGRRLELKLVQAGYWKHSLGQKEFATSLSLYNNARIVTCSD